ncbi:MAG: ribbon-helix-helix protein, CopG family [Anaerolineae bacterium]|nr:ribbon-helix-helix protein, CopG family [Anaerolineae bacterium]
MSNKNQPIYDHRLTVGVTAQMNARLDTLADIRNQPKSELAREAIRLWLDHAEDARMSRAFFTKSFQRRIDHLDWQLEVLVQMLTMLAKRPDLLELAMREALKGDLTEALQNGGLRRAAQNRKPPED